MSGPSSPTSPTPLAFYDPESWCWRTSQGCLLSAAPESLERLPDWGTTADGVLYELQTPALLTAARDGSALLGTPTTDNKARSERFKSKSPNMGELAALLPTPVVNDMGRGKTVEEWDAWTDEMKAKHGNGNGNGPSLSIEAARLLPTPTSQAAKHGSTPDIHANGFGSNLWDLPHLLPTPLANPSHGHYPNRRLLPTPTGRDHKGRNQRNDESCLPGAILALPSPDGSESSDGQHPIPPTPGNSPAGSSNG